MVIPPWTLAVKLRSRLDGKQNPIAIPFRMQEEQCGRSCCVTLRDTCQLVELSPRHIVESANSTNRPPCTASLTTLFHNCRQLFHLGEPGICLPIGKFAISIRPRFLPMLCTVVCAKCCMWMLAFRETHHVCLMSLCSLIRFVTPSCYNVSHTCRGYESPPLTDRISESPQPFLSAG